MIQVGGRLVVLYGGTPNLATRWTNISEDQGSGASYFWNTFLQRAVSDPTRQSGHPDARRPASAQATELSRPSKGPAAVHGSTTMAAPTHAFHALSASPTSRRPARTPPTSITTAARSRRASTISPAAQSRLAVDARLDPDIRELEFVRRTSSARSSESSRSSVSLSEDVYPCPTWQVHEQPCAACVSGTPDSRRRLSSEPRQPSHLSRLSSSSLRSPPPRSNCSPLAIRGRASAVAQVDAASARDSCQMGCKMS